MAKDKPAPFVRIRAEILWALQPFVDYAREVEVDRFVNGVIFAEPHSSGGALIGAVSSHAMTAFYDPDAVCNSAVTLDIPDAAFHAARSPEPVVMQYCGVAYDVDLPDWAQPDTAWMTRAGMFILPRMRHPAWAEEEAEFQPTLFACIASGQSHHLGIDYRLTKGVPADWRKPLRAAIGAMSEDGYNGQSISFRPQVCGLFDRVVDLALFEAEEGEARTVFHRPTRIDGKQGPIVVTVSGAQNFVGLYMPMRDGEYQPPAWHFMHKAA